MTVPHGSTVILTRVGAIGPNMVPALGEVDVAPCARGKFLFAGDDKLYVRGVTYGTFRPNEDGDEYPAIDIVERDFAHMAACGVNAVRVYTVPPPWLLDSAWRHGLRVMVGLPVERFVGLLADKKDGLSHLEAVVRAGVRACRGHPAVLCYAIGNEIPAPVVRWHGRRRMVGVIERLYRAAKAEDPTALVTYVNYPSSEYLQLPFLDLVCFNAYLESQERFAAYLARLQNIAGDRPLIMSEIGLDSLRHGESRQAKVLECQVRTAFASGCAGAFVYAWTDEWYRGGEDVDDWAFGLTRRDRQPKKALAAVRKAFAKVPFPQDRLWPRVSVVLCTYNGGRVIRDCLEGLRKLDYPNFEVIVVNDGSTDNTAAVLREYDFRVITTENRGLASARNTGMEAATGEIVAYLDDDAYPDPHWLTYLAATFRSTRHAAVGGPNIAPPGDGWIAASIANAPGNPAHVLVSDREAEHIPGCNMAVRKASLQAVGGFDPQFRVAGDDVDLCWRLRERGETLGFSPGAMVWHHRRNSVRTFWKQQVGYGRAEGFLERKWPEKYNVAGHTSWSGRVYAQGLAHLLFRPSRIYYGMWGSAPFQRLCEPPAGGLLSLPLMPEWYLVIIALLALSALGTLWTPLLFVLPVAVCAVALPLLQAVASAARASFASAPRSGAAEMLRLRGLTAFLHLIQPLARLRGRLAGGLTPWRRVRSYGLELPRPRTFRVWTERWQAHEERLRSLKGALSANHAIVQTGGEYDRWDLEIRGGMFGATRVLMAVEEHGHGTQLVRLRTWPRCSPIGVTLTLVFAALSTAAAIDPSLPVSVILGMAALLPALRTATECATSTAAIRRTLRQSGFESVR